MLILPKLIYNFNAAGFILFFNSKIYMEKERTQVSQNNLEDKE